MHSFQTFCLELPNLARAKEHQPRHAAAGSAWAENMPRGQMPEADRGGLGRRQALGCSLEEGIRQVWQGPERNRQGSRARSLGSGEEGWHEDAYQQKPQAQGLAATGTSLPGDMDIPQHCPVRTRQVILFWNLAPSWPSAPFLLVPAMWWYRNGLKQTCHIWVNLDNTFLTIALQTEARPQAHLTDEETEVP